MTLLARFVLALVATVAAVACSRKVPADLEITYECRGTGEGICQLYRYTLRADGSVQYHGKQGVKQLGPLSRRIGSERLRGVRDALEELGFFALDSSYYEGNDLVCSTLAVRCDGKCKTIHFDDGASFLASLAPEERASWGGPPGEFTGRLRDHLRLERFCEFLHGEVQLEDWIGTPEETQANRYWLGRDFPEKR